MKLEQLIEQGVVVVGILLLLTLSEGSLVVISAVLFKFILVLAQSLYVALQVSLLQSVYITSAWFLHMSVFGSVRFHPYLQICSGLDERHHCHLKSRCVFQCMLDLFGVPH